MICPYCGTDNDEDFCDISKPHPLPEDNQALEDFQEMIRETLDQVELRDVREMVEECAELTEFQRRELLRQIEKRRTQVPRN